MQKKQFWNSLYEVPGYCYGEEPLPLVQQLWPRLRKGKVLDLAMGEGRNAIFLAEKGFEVHGFDISDVAVQKAKKMAYEKGVQIEAKVADLDMYVFSVFSFDSIILSYFKPTSRYYNEMARALVQGGTVVIESYTTDQLLEKPIRGFGNRDYFSPNELIRNLNGLQILYYNEGEVNGFHIVQCIAKKPADKDAVKYGFVKADEGDKKPTRFRAAEDLFKKK